MVCAGDIGFNIRGQPPFRIKRSTWCRMHHQKCERDDQEKCWYRPEDTQ
jgi:hypothetical protein